MKDKQPAGRPKKAPTCKPALRTDAQKWATLKAKYPGETNRMFNAWVDSLIASNIRCPKCGVCYLSKDKFGFDCSCCGYHEEQ